MCRGTVLRRVSTWRRLARGAKQFSTYFLGTALLAAASLAVIPALVTAEGIGPWSAFALGQSIGAVAGVAVNFGLNYAGPSVVASSEGPVKRGYLASALSIQAALLVPVFGVVILLTLIWAPTSLAMLVLIGSLQQGLSGISVSWYLIGQSRPWAVFLADITPRVVSSVVAILLVYRAGANLLIAGVAMTLGVATVAILTAVLALRDTHGVAAQRPPWRDFITSQAAASWATILDTATRAAPIVLVSWLVPSVFAAFAFFDKVYRQGVTALAPVVQVLQPWVARAKGQHWWSRVWVSHGVAGALVLAAVMVSALVGVPVLTALAAGEVDVTETQAILLAAAIAMWTIPLVSMRAVLLPRGESRFIAYAGTASSIAGVGLVVVGAYLFGIVGALTGVLFGIALLACVYLARVVGLSRRER